MREWCAGNWWWNRPDGGAGEKKVCAEMAVGECMATMGKFFFEKGLDGSKKKCIFAFCKLQETAPDGTT